jgi:TldD protein
MRLRSWCTFPATGRSKLATMEEMTGAVKAMAGQLSAARTAPVGENGTAVVLFEGRAAGQLMRRLLGDQLSGTPPPRGTPAGRGPVPPSELASKLKQRIAPPFLNVWDDPSPKAWPGADPLFGAYDVDDEGVSGRRVDLVKKGVLEDLLMSRTPRKEILRSNGHGRGRPVAGAVRGRVGVLYVVGDKSGSVADQALHSRALKEARTAGQGVPVYVVRLIDTTGGEPGSRSPGVRPLVVVRLREGKEEPVRGISFPTLFPRSLKDLAATGRQPFVYNYLTSADGPVTVGGSPGTIISPSVLFKDVEVKKDTDKNPRPPLYPHPAFAEK